MRRSGGHTAWVPVILLVLLQLASTSVWSGVNTWTSLGPDGGSVIILAVDPQNPDTVYTATTRGGLFATTDGAGSWKALNPLPAGAGAIFSLTVDPHDSGVLYAAGAAGFPGQSGSDAVFKSADGGTTWLPLQSGSAFRLTTPLAIDPRNSNVIYSGSYNSTLKSSAILQSADGGETWRVSSPVAQADCCLLPSFVAIDPNDSANVYAGLVSGLYKSTNRGASWRPLYTYTSADKPQFRNVVINPRNSNVLYGFDVNKGIFESTDGGTNWRAINAGLPTPYGMNSFAMNPQDSSTLYAGTFHGLYKSADGGASWQASYSGLGPDSPAALVVDPLHSATVYAGVPTPQGGVYKSTDGGASWQLRYAGLRGVPVNGVAVDSQHHGTIYVTTPFSRLKSTDAGTSWQGLPASGTGPLVIDPKDTNILYAAATDWEVSPLPGTVWPPLPEDAGLRVIKSQDGGATWNPASSGLPQRCASVQSLSIDPQDTATVYAAFNSEDVLCQSSHTGGSWRTREGGASWTMLAPPPDGGGGGVRGIAVDPRNSNLYGWNGMGIFKSTDRGASWEVISGLPKCTPGPYDGCSRGNVIRAAIDPQTPGTVYAVRNGDGIFKSTDDGASWAAVNSGLPMSFQDGSWKYLTTSLVIDPADPETLYTNGSGVFRSTDGGANWNAVNTGLTTLAVNTLAIDPLDTRTLYSGTAGGVFVITFEE